MENRKYNYVVVESRYFNGEAPYISYGIALAEEQDGTLEVFDSVADISTDRAEVESLADVCNTFQLDPIHLRDVAEDFLATV